MRRTSLLLLLLPLISCLVAVETAARPLPCSRDVPRQVTQLLQRAHTLDWINSKLYTPTLDLYQKFPRSMLTCFASEVKVLTDEWKMEGNCTFRFKLDVGLEKLAKSLDQAEGACPRCEQLQEENAQTFLLRLMETMEQLYSHDCARR